MYGQNPWEGRYFAPPPWWGQPYPPQPQVINTSEEARKLYKEMRKNERRWKKEQEAEATKKKGPDRKPDRIDSYFATKMEVALFMVLIALPIGFAEVMLARFLLTRI